MSLVAHIETVGGRIMNLVEPNIDDIRLAEIAFVLSRMARFGCQAPTDIPYTVGQHSLFCLQLLDDFAENAVPERNLIFNAYLAEKLQGANTIEVIRSSIKRPQKQHVLMHDAAEAYLTDLPTPIKRLPGIYEAYQKLEDNMMDTIYAALELPAPLPFDTVLVKMVDAYALCVEAYHMMPSRGRDWNLPFKPIEHDRLNPVVPKYWKTVQAEFINRFCSLRMEQ